MRERLRKLLARLILWALRDPIAWQSDLGVLSNNLSQEITRVEANSTHSDSLAHQDQDTLRRWVKQAHEHIAELHTKLHDETGAHVREHLSAIQSNPNRHAACPTCGKSYNLATLGVPFNTRSITLSCTNCHDHFEIRPSLFWDKLEVERRNLTQ